MKKETTQQENKCENCRYFSQYYAVVYQSFQKVCCGHCLNRENIKTQINKRMPDPCGLWEPKEIHIAERKNSVKNTLLLMAKRIEQICQI